MKVVAIVQARMGSTRLPNKVMKLINGVPMIELLLRRLSESEKIDQIVVATSVEPRNRLLSAHIESLGFSCFSGSENDVLQRYVGAAKAHHADIIVRITGDCPLVDPVLVDKCIDEFNNSEFDYFCNIHPPTFPDGLDIEVFYAKALERALSETDQVNDHEHVTPYLRNSGNFRVGSLQHDQDLSHLRWTVDEPEDFEVIDGIFRNFWPDINFGWQDVLKLQRINPEIFEANSKFIRNEGGHMGQGQKLWKRAKKIIPGGNMLLSKRPEMFLPDLWPSYYSKASGCTVWDMDGNAYTDVSIMGIGTNILGYGHREVDDAVRDVVNNGNMATFNCPEEVYLADRLIELHPWAEMAKFARTGGEANAIAIRIARAAAGRDGVAVCGYHGWHDWYLSANLGDDQKLAGHLLPGLDPAGVPQELRGTVFPFNYNNFSELEALVNNNKIGVIKMEVMRNAEPEDDFLVKVRNLATERNIVLIFDECTSGFRETFGGLHKKYNVEPDLAVFGKAMGNGYAITAIIGRREVMEAAQSTFISSTFWTERIGPAAALKTLEVMEQTKSWELITAVGKKIQRQIAELAKQQHLSVEVNGLPALTSYTFKGANNLKYKTFITQEMLKKGFLASNNVYVAVVHSEDILNLYFENLERLFSVIADCEGGRDVVDLLDGEVCHSGFKRLN